MSIVTVEQVLRASGFSDAEISRMDQRAVAAFTGVLTQAQQAQAAAELAERSNVDFYENRIAPSLVQWEQEKIQLENEKARIAAEAAFYRTQAEEARKSGFVASDAPTFDAAMGGYVAGAPGGTPGSPQYFDLNQVTQRAGDAIGIIADIEWEHQRLFGQPLPISPTQLIARADAARTDPRTYAARQFGWDAKRQEMQQKQQQEHDDKIRSAAIAENDRKWAERVGNNPDVRMAMRSPEMTEISRAVRSGQRADPLLMAEGERRRATATAIREDIAEQAAER